MRLSLLAAASCWVACLPTPAPLNEGPPAPQVTLQGVRWTHFRGGELIASGTAGELTYQNSTSEFVASQAALRIPSRPGSPGSAPSGALDLFAPTARGALSTRQVDGEGGVTLKTASGLVGKTPRAHFDGVSSSASGPDAVALEGDGYRLSSRGFTLDFPSERFSFQGGVTSRFEGAR